MSTTGTSVRTQALGLRRASTSARRHIRYVLLLAGAVFVAQLIWPLQVSAASLPAAGAEEVVFLPVSEQELHSVMGGCAGCGGGSDSAGGSAGVGPDPVGSPYWEYSDRVLLARPSVAGDLVWQRVNSTDQPWGPITVSYQYKEEFNWSVSGGVPSGYVKGHLGSARSVTRTESTSLTVPARTSYKLYVAYPYERWRYYYSQFQDYDDNTRVQTDSGSATVYDQWTKLNLVQAPVN